MQHFLISTDLSLGDRWKAAFPKGRVTTSLKQALRVAKKNGAFLLVGSPPVAGDGRTRNS